MAARAMTSLSTKGLMNSAQTNRGTMVTKTTSILSPRKQTNSQFEDNKACLIRQCKKGLWTKFEQSIKCAQV